MTTDVRDLLPEYALGLLDPETTRRVDRALASSPELVSELARWTDTTGALAASLSPVEPAPAVRTRLLASIGQVSRLERFAPRFAQIFDVALERARELLRGLDDPRAWLPGPGAGTWLQHFAAGPATAGADTGFVKVAPGAQFPWHRHDGEEHALILQGAGRDAAGFVLRAGDECVLDGGSEHDFVGEPAGPSGDTPYVFAVRVYGVRFDVARPA